jgi:hypothetical protein
MSIASALNWRRSVLGNTSAPAYARTPALGEHCSSVVAKAVQPVWRADAPRPMGYSQPAQPDATMLAVLWGRQAN